MTISPRQRRRASAIDRARTRSGLTLSDHALLRMHEFDVHEIQVHECVTRPEQSYPSDRDRYGEHRRMYQRGRIACVVDEASRCVVTVLPRIVERWEHQPRPMPAGLTRQEGA